MSSDQTDESQEILSVSYNIVVLMITVRYGPGSLVVRRPVLDTTFAATEQFEEKSSVFGLICSSNHE